MTVVRIKDVEFGNNTTTDWSSEYECDEIWFKLSDTDDMYNKTYTTSYKIIRNCVHEVHIDCVRYLTNFFAFMTFDYDYNYVVNEYVLYSAARYIERKICFMESHLIISIR